MTWLLDTNVCVAFLNGSDDTVRERLIAHSPAEVVLCSVVKAELLYGARKSTRVDENLARLTSFFRRGRRFAFCFPAMSGPTPSCCSPIRRLQLASIM